MVFSLVLILTQGRSSQRYTEVHWHCERYHTMHILVSGDIENLNALKNDLQGVLNKKMISDCVSWDLTILNHMIVSL